MLRPHVPGTHVLAASVHEAHHVLTRLREWPVTSQLRARRNAMVAATACARRRSEREEVADFLAAHDTSPETSEAAAGERASRQGTPAATAHG